MAPQRLRLRNVFSDLVVGAQPSLLPQAAAPLPLAALAETRLQHRKLPLTWLAVSLVCLPVFVQAPWVHSHPLGATLATAPLLAAGIALGLSEQPQRQQVGALLVGFAGSWLCGSLFWGWCRQHPLIHLPIECLALPWALAGLRSRWNVAGAFYLASLLGTAATDAAMALTGVMPLWPQVLQASPSEAGALLSLAAQQLLHPGHLAVIGGFAVGLLGLARWLWQQGGIARISGATLAATLAIDGLFLALALSAPGWSGVL